MSFGRALRFLLLATTIIAILVDVGVQGYVFRRRHGPEERRNMTARPQSNDTSIVYDTAVVENYLRNYLHGPQNDRFIYFNHDSLAVYAGPWEQQGDKKNVLRGWAMFDKRTRKFCDLDAVFNNGELAIFTCPEPGLYHAYAIRYDLEVIVEGVQVTPHEKHWVTRKEKDQFSLLTGDTQTGPTIFQVIITNALADATPEMRMEYMLKSLYPLSFSTTQAPSGAPPPPGLDIVISDPVVVRGSHYCYYWMYQLTEIANPDDQDLLYDLDIWIAEPSAVGIRESRNVEPNKIEVSDYSRVITNRFFTTGLFPCVRKAHPAVQVLKEIEYVRATDQSLTLERTPHWNALLKVHTDRLISTLSDVYFTIASRQNTGSFHCFVGDTRVFINLRNFEFVPIGQLEEKDINLDVSQVDEDAKHEFKFRVTQVWGHGVHHIGYKGPKRYQPASNRSDMMIVINPCVAQEFAFSVGGSLYIAEGLLQDGPSQARKVSVPFFPDSKRRSVSDSATNLTSEPDEYLRVYDVGFTPTHVAFLMSEGYLVLHSPSAGKYGLADFKDTMKFRPDAFVKRRWCPRTINPKISRMILPVFSTKGTIIILQVYPTEGNVRIWFKPPSPTCLPEGHEFVPRGSELVDIINETEIHYEEFAAVRRTNERTGLAEPPPPYRAPPPPQPVKDLHAETDYILDSQGNWVESDPHFPPQLTNPASYEVNTNYTDYNQIVTYVVVAAAEGGSGSQGLLRILQNNGLTVNLKPADQPLVSVEFTAEEKEFMYALIFQANEIPSEYAGQGSQQKPFQMVVATLAIANFPYRVRLQTELGTREKDRKDEILIVYTDFPGVVIIRSKPYKVSVKDSRDADEDKEIQESLAGNTEVDFNPELFPLGTSIPSYVLNLGDVLLYSSIESRYARPLHYFPWYVVDNASRADSISLTGPPPLTFLNSTTRFRKEGILYDPVVTEQGMISVLWRKAGRHIIQDDAKCLTTKDGDQQTAAMGSAITLEGLREIKAFFRNDNVFQRATPDGEIIYGVYNVKPRSSFRDCGGRSWDETKSSPEPCVDQPPATLGSTPVPVCTRENAGFYRGCRDPGYIEFCRGPIDRVSGTPAEKILACLRLNSYSKCDNSSGSRETDISYTDSKPQPAPAATGCDPDSDTVMKCFPKHATREEIRTIDLTGVSFESYLLGSLQEVRSIHPESFVWDEDELRMEPDICPFASFELHQNKVLNFGEVGYLARLTGEISYFGTGIPTEADLLVEFEPHVGLSLEISSSMVEERHFTTIRKTVDVRFVLTDYMLHTMLDFNPGEKKDIHDNNFTYEDVRARDPFDVFSISFRPSIVNTRCKNRDYFKTVQFNIGCNAYGGMRLIAEATPLRRVNWTDALKGEGLKWIRDEDKGILRLPKQHIYYRQYREDVFNCTNVTDYCDIPYYHLFKDDIFTISYRDFLEPKFEQFMTVSARVVTGNVVLYDMLGSQEFNWTLNKMYAGCHNTEHFWYHKLLQGTKRINSGTFEHENVYEYYNDCFSTDPSQGEREQSQNLYVSPFYFFNKTNKNMLKFLRKRNQLFIFRAVVINTKYNRFTYCKYLDTFFMVRVTGIPIPRQGLDLWMYASIFLLVFLALVISYAFFTKFYSGINTSV